MELKLPFDTKAPVSGEASAVIDAPKNTVFSFVAENYFENYPKWAPEIVEVTALNGKTVAVGIKGRQVREENEEKIESTFVVDEYLPDSRFALQGLEPAFKSTYLTESQGQEGQTKLTFRFELLDVDIFMRPFVKLIKAAIEEGAENTVEKIKELISKQPDCSGSH